MAVAAATTPGTPAVLVGLEDASARDPTVAGSKAAALARARAAGLPVLPGWVITTAALPSDVAPAAGRIWADHSRHRPDGSTRLVVRSSSTVEDGVHRSMAGMFRSVNGVTSEEELAQAVHSVLRSAALPGEEGLPAPMAVLVQPELPPRPGGVLFGVDPVSGRNGHFALVVHAEGPVGVVQGSDGTPASISRWGRPLGPTNALDREQARHLARLGRRVEDEFGGPQDVEWGTDDVGRVWLLQTRPVTAVATSPAGRKAPVLGPEAVCETFPEPLSPLEVDLWVHPLGEGLERALALVGAVSARRLRRGPAVVSIGGWVAADLDLLSGSGKGLSWRSWLDPRRWGHRLLSAWRVGRLRAALPGLASDVLARADSDLTSVGPLEDLSDRSLLGVLSATRPRLVALHGHEILMGLLASAPSSSTAAASVALRLLAEGRAESLTDDEIVAQHPTVLALLPPRVGAAPDLPTAIEPPAATSGDAGSSEGEVTPAELREALRLRARWVQELGARAGAELARRLLARGVLTDLEHARWLGLEELYRAVTTGNVPSNLAARASAGFGPPLPTRFRLDPEGRPVAVPGDGRAAGDGERGVGASTGRGHGPVYQGGGPPPAGSVWVVRSLDPRLAPWLPRLAGLVAETGTALSHLAILAREYGIPAVVGVTGARELFPDGARVVLDGRTGEVGLVDDRLRTVESRTAQPGPRVGAA